MAHVKQVVIFFFIRVLESQRTKLRFPNELVAVKQIDALGYPKPIMTAE